MAMALMPNCNSISVSLDPSVTLREGDVLNEQQPVLHISLPRHTLELYDHDVSPGPWSSLTEGRHLHIFFSKLR